MSDEARTQQSASIEESERRHTVCVDLAQFEEEFLQCQICVYKYNQCERRPKILSCGHVFCLSCLQQILDENAYSNTLKCPTCRSETEIRTEDLSKLTPALYVNQMIDFMANIEVQNHCSEHRSQELNFYCAKCSIPICRDCTVLCHKEDRGHIIIDLSKILDARISQSEEVERESKEILERMKFKSCYLENASRSLNSHEKILIKKVDDKFDECITALKQRQAKLKAEISETVSALRNGIESHNSHVKEQISKFEEVCDDFCKTRASRDVHKLLTMNQEMTGQKKKFRMETDEDYVELFKTCEVNIENEKLKSYFNKMGVITVKTDPEIMYGRYTHYH